MRIIHASDSEIHIVLNTLDIDIGLDGALAGEHPHDRMVRELEARVKWLEGALTSVLQSRPAYAGSGEAALFAKTTKLMQLGAMPALAEPGEPAAAESQRIEQDDLRFTGDFATLDDRLREQTAMETATRRQPDLAPPVMIDPALIDLAFARPAPMRIEVRADIEDTYPHLLERIVATWRSPESARYLRKLIVDERGGRQGFPFEVMSELLMLSALLETPAEEPRVWTAGLMP